MRQRGWRTKYSLARSFHSWQESMQRGHMQICINHRESGLGKTNVQRSHMKWKGLFPQSREQAGKQDQGRGISVS